MVTSWKKIFLKRIKSKPFYIFCDIISTIVSFYPITTSFGGASRLCFILLILRAWRVYDCLYILEKTYKYIFYPIVYRFILSFKIVWSLVLIVHYGGSMFYLIAIRLHESDTWLSQLSSNSSSCPAVETSSTNQYVAAIYWAITTVTSVGYGDLHPENDIERVFGIIFIALGAGLLSYITGLMTILFGQEIENNSDHNILAAYEIPKKDLTPHLLKPMLSYLRSSAHPPQYKMMVLNILPYGMRVEILQHLYLRLFHTSYLFHFLSEDSIILLVSDLFIQYYQPGENIIIKREEPSHFFMLVEGELEVHLAGDDHQTVIINVKGHLVGEIGVLYCKRHPFKVQAKTSCQLLRLNRESLVKIAKFNGGDIYIILDRLIKHIGNNRNIGSAMKRVVQDPSFALTHDLVPFPLSLYDLVLAKGDHALPRLRNGREPTLDDETEDDRLIPNYLIGLMIKWGWNIDDIDHKGRNALHAASLRGSERWVRYLLACGMDPNQKDYDGGQPLFLAVSKGHDAVQDILVGAGAVCTVTPNEPSCDMGLLMAFKKKEEELEEKIRELEEEKATLQTLIDTLNDLRSNQSTWNDDF